MNKHARGGSLLERVLVHRGIFWSRRGPSSNTRLRYIGSRTIGFVIQHLGQTKSGSLSDVPGCTRARNSDDFIFGNTFRDIAYILETMTDSGTKFEHECYDVGHLYSLAHFIDRGLVKPPFFVQLVFGILGGIGAELDNLMFMKRTADRLFGPANFQWSLLAAGRHQMPFVTQAALMRGNVRVGLEDSIFIERGKLAESNAQQVLKIRRILAEMGHEPATPAEARQMLGLKGKNAVKY
jgi:uncharacterized protein (DUF849 family)